MAKMNDLTGKTFGMLRVIGRAGVDRQGYATWIVRCRCGTIKEMRGCNLKETSTCGCSRQTNPTNQNLRDVTYRNDDKEIIVCHNVPTQTKRDLIYLAGLKQTSLEATVRFALIEFAERQKRQEWFKEAVVAVNARGEVVVEEEEGNE